MEKFEEWVGNFRKKSIFVIKIYEMYWLVISHNKYGVHVFNRYGAYNFYRVKNIPNPNVIGAGDIFFAGIIYNHLNNLDIFTSVELACYAASKCVGKKN